MITLTQLKKHIKKCKKKGIRYDFLRLVENADLTNEVKELFTFYTQSGAQVYDWVKGNNKLKALIDNT